MPCSCQSGSSIRVKTRRMASSGTTPASGIGSPGSGGARSWSRRPSGWSTSASPCSLASLETTGSPTSSLCWPKTLRHGRSTDFSVSVNRLGWRHVPLRHEIGRECLVQYVLHHEITVGRYRTDPTVVGLLDVEAHLLPRIGILRYRSGLLQLSFGSFRRKRLEFCKAVALAAHAATLCVRAILSRTHS